MVEKFGSSEWRANKPKRRSFEQIVRSNPSKIFDRGAVGVTIFGGMTNDTKVTAISLTALLAKKKIEHYFDSKKAIKTSEIAEKKVKIVNEFHKEKQILEKQNPELDLVIKEFEAIYCSSASNHSTGNNSNEAAANLRDFRAGAILTSRIHRNRDINNTTMAKFPNEQLKIKINEHTDSIVRKTKRTYRGDLVEYFAHEKSPIKTDPIIKFVLQEGILHKNQAEFLAGAVYMSGFYDRLKDT